MTTAEMLGVTEERLRHDVAVMSLTIAALERHNGNAEAADAQILAWMMAAGPKVVEMLVVEKTLATMGQGRVH